MACSGMLQEECPLLVPLNQEGTLYDGFITVRERDFRLHVALPPDGQVRNARLHCSWQLKQALRGHQALVKQRLEQSQSLEDFIVELKMILEASLRSKRALHAPPPPSYYSRLIGEIEALGWETLTFIDPNFSTIGFSFWDTSGRPHTITLNLKPQYPVEAPECLVDIPVTFDLHWTPQSSLATLRSHFLAAVEALKDFWDTMDEIDRNTWVLEPEKPSRASTTRRIAIGNSASLHLEVDPQHPKTFPECRFLGADHGILKPQYCTTCSTCWRLSFLRPQHTARPTSAWSVASVMHTGWRRQSLTRCATSPGVASPSTRPASTSG
ncbi:E3 ubiquitin-protein ligase FANCL isoform X4 [Lampetra fluviatilis]